MVKAPRQSIEACRDRGRVPMGWYGEFLFVAEIDPGVTGVEVCATDAAGNETCVTGE